LVSQTLPGFQQALFALQAKPAVITNLYLTFKKASGNYKSLFNLQESQG
jgi:hypothetical protein